MRHKGIIHARKSPNYLVPNRFHMKIFHSFFVILITLNSYLASAHPDY